MIPAAIMEALIIQKEAEPDHRSVYCTSYGVGNEMSKEEYIIIVLLYNK